jgi:unsaturated rhamnogalacturonyl hydrolase
MKPLLSAALSLLVLAGCGRAATVPTAQTASGQAQAAGLTSAIARAFDPSEAWAADAETMAAQTPRSLDMRSPALGGVTFGTSVPLDLRLPESLTGRYTLKLDDRDITESVRPGPIKHQWLGRLDGLAPGRHALVLLDRQSGRTVFTNAFEHRAGSERDRLVALADAVTRRLDPSHMGWDWGEGLLLYALVRLDQQLGTPRYRPFIERYYAHHLAKGLPTIDWSDKCAPALAALELYQATGDEKYKRICDAVVTYLMEAKPTKGGGLNHLGTFWLSKIYPQSMWVDSLMMYDVFAARYGRAMGDAKLTEFAARQPLHFAKVLQDPRTKLWKHAHLNSLKLNIPSNDVYWLRGNGWVMASMPEVLSQLPADHPKRPELRKSFQATASALAPHQTETGLWYTVLNRPGKTYLEASGTALLAYGMLKGVHEGHLPASFREPGRRAYQALLGRLEEKADGPSMPEISHNTAPYSFLGYALVPQRNDLAFGLAAMILAGIEFDREP